MSGHVDVYGFVKRGAAWGLACGAIGGLGYGVVMAGVDGAVLGILAGAVFGPLFGSPIALLVGEATARGWLPTADPARYRRAALLVGTGATAGVSLFFFGLLYVVGERGRPRPDELAAGVLLPTALATGGAMIAGRSVVSWFLRDRPKTIPKTDLDD